MAARPPTSSIEIEVVQEDPFDKRFRNLPNALLRGERDDVLDLDFRGYTLRARALLSALLSMKDRYRCSRDRINALGSELGESAMDTVIKELKTKRNLRTKRINGGGGKFVWRWTVSLRPMALATANEDPAEDVSAGGTMGRLSGDGLEEPAAIPRSSMDGSAMDGSLGGLKEEEPSTKRTKRSKEPTSSPPTRRLTVVPPQAKPEEAEEDESLKGLRATAEAILDDVQHSALTTPGSRMRGAKRAHLAKMIAERLAAGWSRADAEDALSGPLDNVHSVYAVLRSRIADLMTGDPPAAPKPRAQAGDGMVRCPQCAPYRPGWIDADLDRPSRCPCAAPRTGQPWRPGFVTAAETASA